MTNESSARLKLEAEMTGMKQTQEEQVRLVKKLQRKLLLVTKERESYKEIIDSFEKEITVTEDNFYQDKISALERNITEYKAIVEMLEEEKKVSSPAVDSVARSELLEWKNKVESLEDKNEKLEMELERRAMKGDYNPGDTKVIHFLNNPTSAAVDKRAKEMSELMNENTALKARIQLLEEGQTKDLTLMVGAKVEEGEAEKVRELKTELEKAEKREKRFMEAFTKTSHEFREVVYKLTGYRIDVKSDNMYHLKPIYANNAEDKLVFRRDDDGEILMLESELSEEHPQLIRDNLERRDSIPMYLAELIRQLFFNKFGMTENEEEVETYNDGDDDEDDENMGDDSDERESSSENSNNDASSDPEEIIEIDDD